MKQHDEFRWVEADDKVAARIMEQFVDVLDRERPDFPTAMFVIDELLKLAWATVCPQCRGRAMDNLRLRLPVIAMAAEELAAEQDTPRRLVIEGDWN